MRQIIFYKGATHQNQRKKNATYAWGRSLTSNHKYDVKFVENKKNTLVLVSYCLQVKFIRRQKKTDEEVEERNEMNDSKTKGLLCIFTVWSHFLASDNQSHATRCPINGDMLINKIIFTAFKVTQISVF